ncbi:MAG: damage-inducible protein DinB [Saprospiraceae bacterium]|uniref:DinB family protein n=1 Tax=Candidatus Brachybacter algidus TaxID=2982024 RepID=UPI00257A3AFD|nr:DinB family protein [Candidatus Brachybacter algidus]MBK7602247.1 damage-inducible protein DinB [Candidatus Brachybacter algidus]
MLLETKQSASISTDSILSNWMGHRNLTRKIIYAFPEKELFTYSIGGMRTFAQMVEEIMIIAEEGMNGILTGVWNPVEGSQVMTELMEKKSKTALLKKWDEITEHINHIWPQLEPEHFMKVDKAFGAYENTNLGTIQYAYDNEIHHRAQAYVYLRALGIQPPFFWDRY